MDLWRERILQSTLWAALVLATIAYLPGVWAAWSSDLGLLVIADTIVWAGILILALARSLPFRVRASLFLGAWFLFALLLLFILGPIGAGIMWLLAVPILAALFFGYRGAFFGIGLLVVVTVSNVFLLPWRNSISFFPEQDITYSAVSWLGSAGSLLFIAMLLSLALAELLRRLGDTVEALGDSNQRLTRIMEEREGLQEQILLSQKQSALGTLAAGMTHDFNNLLVPILVASEQARDDAEVESPQRRHLDSVIRSAERAKQLVRRILDYTQNKEGSGFQPVSVVPVLREVAGLLRSSAPAAIEFSYAIDDDNICALSDPDELHQILMNLGTNACHAMPRGGTLTWGIIGANGNDDIRIDICDTGHGIPADVKERIFDPFFTTKQIGDGAGLGLSIVHRLITAMNGRIEVDSDGKSGTCFHIYLPVATKNESTHAAQSAEVVSTQANTSPRHVLVVDDEDMVRGVLKAILARSGFVVHEASSPESALRQLFEDPQSFDLMICDLAMPGMTGVELSEQVRQLLPELPIIVSSGYFSEADRATLEKLGITRLLQKPFSREELTRFVADALNNVA